MSPGMYVTIQREESKVDTFFSPDIVQARNDRFPALEPWLVHEAALPQSTQQPALPSARETRFDVPKDVLGTLLNVSSHPR